MSGEPMRFNSPSGRTHAQRITALEGRMSAVEKSVEKVANDTTEILAVLKGTKTIAAYIKRYGRHTIVFGAGIMTSAGFLNPAVGDYINKFFGM